MYRIALDMPKSMVEKAVDPNIKDRPYDLCLDCPSFSKTCDGPNILAMSNERWVEWANARMEQLGISRSKLAILSGVPEGTVISVLSGRTKDARFSTIRDMTKALVGGCWGQYPCHLSALMMNSELVEDDADVDKMKLDFSLAQSKMYEYETEIESLRLSLNTAEEKAILRVAEMKDEAQKKIDYLRNRVDKLDSQLESKDRTIKTLGIAIAAMTLFVIVFLIVDILALGI